MAKNLVLSTILDPFGQNLGPKKFFCEFYLHQKLEIVASYHYMQFQGKLMNQTRENDKNLVFGTILAPLTQF